MTILEEKLEQLEDLRTDNVELQDVNEQLLQELEKRDRAVEEAVAIICHLEEKVRRYQSTTTDVDPADQGMAGDLTSSSLPSSHERPSGVLPQEDEEQNLFAAESRQASSLADSQEPTTRLQHAATQNLSFLASRSDKNSALRSLYLAGETDSKARPSSYASSSNQVSTSTSDSVHASSADEADSPRLSILSESSFLSVYGDRNDFNLDGPPADVIESSGDVAGLRGSDSDLQPNMVDQTTPLAVETWIMQPTPHQTQDRSSSRKPRESLHIKNHHGPQHFWHLQPQGTRERPRIEPRPLVEMPAQSVAKQRYQPFADSLLQGPIFGGTTLPPTPDTLSTVDHDGRTESSSDLTAKGHSSSGSSGSSTTPVSFKRSRSNSDLGPFNIATLAGFNAKEASALVPVIPRQIPDHLPITGGVLTTSTSMALTGGDRHPHHPDPLKYAGPQLDRLDETPPNILQRSQLTSSGARTRPSSAMNLSQSVDSTSRSITSSVPSAQQYPVAAQGEKSAETVKSNRVISPARAKSNGAWDDSEMSSSPISELRNRVRGQKSSWTQPSPPNRRSSLSFATSLKKRGLASRLFGLSSTSPAVSNEHSHSTGLVVDPNVHSRPHTLNAIGRSLSHNPHSSAQSDPDSSLSDIGQTHSENDVDISRAYTQQMASLSRPPSKAREVNTSSGLGFSGLSSTPPGNAMRSQLIERHPQGEGTGAGAGALTGRLALLKTSRSGRSNLPSINAAYCSPYPVPPVNSISSSGTPPSQASATVIPAITNAVSDGRGTGGGEGVGREAGGENGDGRAAKSAKRRSLGRSMSAFT